SEWCNNAASSRNPPKRVRRSRLTAVGILVVYGEEDVKENRMFMMIMTSKFFSNFWTLMPH
ncbi:hypothetical protein, partial [Shewanella hafniensis]|uniref:hypothetical protein n=1 Tax=Shewanella hafniensis TaxID=365590 RepID=UPI0020104BD4